MAAGRWSDALVPTPARHRQRRSSPRETGGTTMSARLSDTPPSRWARLARRVKSWYSLDAEPIEDRWTQIAACRTVSPLAMAQFRGRHPTLTATEADLVVEALRQWIRIEGRHPGPRRSLTRCAGTGSGGCDEHRTVALSARPCSTPLRSRLRDASPRPAAPEHSDLRAATHVYRLRPRRGPVRPAAAVPSRRRGPVA